MATHLRGRRVWPLAPAMALVLIALSAPVADAAAAKSSSVAATISPTQVALGDVASFTLQFAVGASSSNSLGSVQIVVPAGFAGVTPGTTTVPGGWVYSLPACSSDSPVGCGAPGTTLVQAATPSNNGAQKVLPGKTLTLTVSATAAAKSAQSWNVAAKNSAAWSTGQLLSLQGPSPVVTVYGAPAKLSFGTPPPAQMVAGDTIGATVHILDSDGATTLSTAQVTLSGTSLGGTATVTAVAGTATFTGLTLTKAGTITVTASSGTLRSAISPVVVTPSPPAKLVVTGPSGSVSAGGTFDLRVLVTDTYDNSIDPQVVVALSVGDTAAASQTTSLGSTTFRPTAPTAPGTYLLTVTSSGLSDTSHYLTVVAGPPVVLTIDRAADQAGLGVLTRNVPFDVVVTARDALGNPSAYTGTVTLATSGGAGNALGTLAGSITGTFAGSSTATVRGATYTGYGNAVTLTGSAPGLAFGSTSIDVALFATVRNSSPGENTTVTDINCTEASPSVPVCSSLILPNGANGRITLSQGACNPFTSCLSGSQNQALLANSTANLTDPVTGQPLYTRDHPAEIQLRCDKTLCGGAGTNAFPILFQPTGGGPFLTAPACPSKGHIGANQTFCQDFVQDHRDSAGDLVAFVLFLDDAKSTFG